MLLYWIYKFGYPVPYGWDTWFEAACTKNTTYENGQNISHVVQLYNKHYGTVLLPSFRWPINDYYANWEGRQKYWRTRKIDFGALIGRDNEAREIHTSVDDDTVAVEHCENEEELIDANINRTASQSKAYIKHGRVDSLPFCSADYIYRKECPSLQEADPLVDSSLRLSFKSTCQNMVLGWRTSLIVTDPCTLCTSKGPSRSSKYRSKLFSRRICFSAINHHHTGLVQ